MFCSVRNIIKYRNHCITMDYDGHQSVLNECILMDEGPSGVSCTARHQCRPPAQAQELAQTQARARTHLIDSSEDTQIERGNV